MSADDGFLDGAAIREELTARGQSITSLALDAGLDRSNLSTLINEGKSPSAETLERLATALGWTTDRLLGRVAP